MHRISLALLGLMALAYPAHATLINFDDGSNGSVIGNFYGPLGVTFSGASWAPNFGFPGSSGSLGLYSTTGAFQWTSTTPVIATFSSPTSSVSAVVTDLGGNGFTLNAYDATVGGNLVGTTTMFGVGAGVGNFQTLGVSAVSILRVEMFQVTNTFGDGVMVDNFQFASSATAPEPGTLALLVLGGVGLAARLHRRK